MATFGSLPAELVGRVASHLCPGDYLALAAAARDLRAVLHPRCSEYGAARFLDSTLRRGQPSRAILLLSRADARARERHAARAVAALLRAVDAAPDVVIPVSAGIERLIAKGRLDVALSQALIERDADRVACVNRWIYFQVVAPGAQADLRHALRLLCTCEDEILLSELLNARVVNACALFANSYEPVRTALKAGRTKIVDTLLPAYLSTPFLTERTELPMGTLEFEGYESDQNSSEPYRMFWTVFRDVLETSFRDGSADVIRASIRFVLQMLHAISRDASGRPHTLFTSVLVLLIPDDDLFHGHREPVSAFSRQTLEPVLHLALSIRGARWSEVVDCFREFDPKITLSHRSAALLVRCAVWRDDAAFLAFLLDNTTLGRRCAHAPIVAVPVKIARLLISGELVDSFKLAPFRSGELESGAGLYLREVARRTRLRRAQPE